jgi:hypothetical protein
MSTSPALLPGVRRAAPRERFGQPAAAAKVPTISFRRSTFIVSPFSE